MTRCYLGAPTRVTVAESFLLEDDYVGPDAGEAIGEVLAGIEQRATLGLGSNGLVAAAAAGAAAARRRGCQRFSGLA